jgi:acyl carrier protein
MPSSNLPVPTSAAEELRASLKRCRPEVVAAAVEFRETSNPHLLPAIITGVIERFVEPEQRALLRSGDDTLKLSEDLGLDSLTLMEIVLLTEDVFHITISAEEMHHLCTLGEIKHFISAKIATV